MRSFMMKSILVLLLLTTVVWANEPVKASGLDPSSRIAGKQIGRMFKAAGAKIEKPAPAVEASNLDVLQPGLPQGGRTLHVSAYSYCLRGRTASGRYTEHGVVAVDPRVIPLGSRLYIPGYGWAVAADTGGAIVGNKIDLWMPTLAQCYQWGVRPVTIQVFPAR